MTNVNAMSDDLRTIVSNMRQGKGTLGAPLVDPSVYDDLLFNSKTAYQAKKYDEAFPLMKKAACTGDKESQWMLGHMYLLGQGVARDDFTGYAWIKAASEFNNAEYRGTAEKIAPVAISNTAYTAKTRPRCASERETPL